MLEEPYGAFMGAVPNQPEAEPKSPWNFLPLDAMDMSSGRVYGGTHAMGFTDKLPRKLFMFGRRRFEALRWPLSSLAERVAATRSDGIINARAAGSRFPIRALRYWWVRCALLQEVRKRNEKTVVADAGCSRGHIGVSWGRFPTRNGWDSTGTSTMPP